MKIAFASNFLTHHQLPFCREMIKLTGGEFVFIATEGLAEEQKNLGYEDMNEKYEFVLKAYESAENLKKALDVCESADVVIKGSAPKEFIEARLKQNKLTFEYSEHLYKNSCPYLKLPYYFLKNIPQMNKKKYLLCSSAYTSGDYAKSLRYIGKAFKWGYFPETESYDIDNLMEKKKGKKLSVLWVARIIDWKHPEAAVYVAERLKKEGYEFRLNIIGRGDMEQEIQNMINNKGLNDCISMIGSIPAGDVRNHMESANIFLMTSDRNEGWGAVLNEAMNSGCAVVASSKAGAVPYLIDDNKDGLVFRSGDWQDLYNKVKFLAGNPQKCEQMGKNAYMKIINEWNAKEAAKRLIMLIENLKAGKKTPYKTGICSKAEIYL